MAVFEILLKPGRAQTFQVTLGGILYRFTMNWNDVSNCWILDIADSTDTPILSGIPVVTGAGLLEQFRYLAIAKTSDLLALTIAFGHVPDEVPTFKNLGVDSHLFYITAG